MTAAQMLGASLFAATERYSIRDMCSGRHHQFILVLRAIAMVGRRHVEDSAVPIGGRGRAELSLPAVQT
jgi:hypothetical protein